MKGSIKMPKKLSYTTIRTLGIAAVVGIAGLTAFTVNLAVNDANDYANGAYIQTADNSSVPSVVTTTVPTTEPPTTELVTTAPVTEPVTTTTTVVTTTVPVTTSAPVTEKTTAPVTTTEPENHTDNCVVETQDDIKYDFADLSIDKDGHVVYTVRTGDWLSRIGERYGFTVEELAKANPYISNVDLIHSGEKVILPGDEAFVKYIRSHIK